jgi:hypothetical protein
MQQGNQTKNRSSGCEISFHRVLPGVGINLPRIGWFVAIEIEARRTGHILFIKMAINVKLFRLAVPPSLRFNLILTLRGVALYMHIVIARTRDENWFSHRRLQFCLLVI